MVYEVVYLLALAFAGVFSAAVGYFLWSKKLGSDGTVFVAFMLLHPVIAVVVGLELLVRSPSLSSVLYGLHNALVVPILPLFFAFAALYTGRRRLVSKPVVAALGAWTVLAMTLFATNPLHHLIWTDYATVAGPLPHVEGTPTPLFGALSLPHPLLNFAAMVLLLHRFVFGSGTTRAQAITLFVGFLPPWIVYGMWGAGALPGPLNGGFVIGSTWSFALVAFAVYRYDLFDVAPLARETVFSELEDPVIVVDVDYRLLDANRAALDTFPQLEGEEDAPLETLLPGAFEDGSAAPSSTFTTYGGAESREYAVTSSTLTAGGEVRGYALVVRDVTERREHVRDLEQQTAQLERFASTLSHDIRNPLNVAQGWVDLSIERGETDDLDNARDALERIQRIIEDMLTLTREGETIDDLEPVPLRTVVEEAWETTDTKEATLSLSLDDASVYAHASRLQNVFENLFRNAIEHGAADATVTVGRRPDGFYVEDDGVGIPPEHRADVFDYTFTTAQDGTGLGLAIVEAIVQAHGWDARTEAGADGGARIVVSDVDFVEAAAPEPAVRA